jgi:hypothetical protein
MTTWSMIFTEAELLALFEATDAQIKVVRARLCLMSNSGQSRRFESAPATSGLTSTPDILLHPR